MIGLGSLSFCLGQSLWTYYESVRGVEVPYPGPPDIGYFLAYPCLIAGVVLLFGSMHVAGRTRLLLDSAIAASSVGVLSWHFLLEPLWRKQQVGPLEKFLSLAYPLSDVAILFGAFVLLSSSRSNRSLRRSLAFLSGGLVLLSFADTTFSYYNLLDAYKTGSWFDWAFSFGWLLVGYASLIPLWWPHQDLALDETRTLKPDQPLPPVEPCYYVLRVLTPYAAGVLAFSFVAC